MQLAGRIAAHAHAHGDGCGIGSVESLSRRESANEDAVFVVHTGHIVARGVGRRLAVWLAVFFQAQVKADQNPVARAVGSQRGAIRVGSVTKVVGVGEVVAKIQDRALIGGDDHVRIDKWNRRQRASTKVVAQRAGLRLDTARPCHLAHHVVNARREIFDRVAAEVIGDRGRLQDAELSVVVEIDEDCHVRNARLARLAHAVVIEVVVLVAGNLARGRGILERERRNAVRDDGKGREIGQLAARRQSKLRGFPSAAGRDARAAPIEGPRIDDVAVLIVHPQDGIIRGRGKIVAEGRAFVETV